MTRKTVPADDAATLELKKSYLAFHRDFEVGRAKAIFLKRFGYEAERVVTPVAGGWYYIGPCRQKP